MRNIFKKYEMRYVYAAIAIIIAAIITIWVLGSTFEVWWHFDHPYSEYNSFNFWGLVIELGEHISGSF